MAKKICNYPGCNELVEMKDRYCTAHRIEKKEAVKQKNRRYDEKLRNKKHDKFYHSKAWKSVRDMAMKQTGGLCVECLKLGMTVKADVVDHIIPLEKDYSLRLNLTNLQPLCHSHHNKKTINERGGRV